MMGFFLLMAAGNDSTKATYSQRHARADGEPRAEAELVEDPSLIPGAVEESLRMFPAFAHFRRTATRDTELHGQKIKKGEKVVMWYVSSNRDETRYEDPDRFDIHRNAEHQAFGAGGRHFCLGTALARLELRDPDRGDARAATRRSRSTARPVAARGAVRQPAQDAPGEARGLSGGQGAASVRARSESAARARRNLSSRRRPRRSGRSRRGACAARMHGGEPASVRSRRRRRNLAVAPGAPSRCFCPRVEGSVPRRATRCFRGRAPSKPSRRTL